MIELERDIRKQLYEGIVEELKIMSAPLRDVFMLRHYQGRSEGDIARILGLSPIEVAALLQQAEILIREGVHVPRPLADDLD